MTRWVEVGRGAWGLLLLADPSLPLRAVRDAAPDRRALVVARVLGGRHVVQAGLSGLRPAPEVLAMGVWVDAVHAVTALGLAGTDRSRSRLALVDATVAATFAAVGWHDLARPAGSGSGSGSEATGWQLRWSRSLLGILPGGAALLRRVGAPG